MSDNQWPFGNGGERAEPEPSEQPGDVSDAQDEQTRAEGEGWGWADDAADEQPAPPAERPGRWARFGRWRRSRPFWGALLVLVGGLVVALIPLGAYRIILVAPSVAIASGVGWVVVILGVVTFMTPTQNKLYGLLAVLMGVIALIASNLGGFLLGSILTIVGGALAFAWMPLPPEEQPEAPGVGGPVPEQRTAASEDRRVRNDKDNPRDQGVAQRSWIET